MSMCRVFSCVVGRGCLLWPVHFLGKTLLAFALLHFVLQSQICLLLHASLDFPPLHSSPLWWKKAKHWRIDAFELWCWRRLLRVPWTARRYNQSILKETPVLGVHWKDWCWGWNSSTLAWNIPWMEEPGRLQSMGSLRVGHNWATSLSLFTFMHWRRKWQPSPV